jgi:hypothetical protein
MSFIVVVYEGNYPDDKGSSCTLLGSYLSRKAGRFVSEAHKRRNKLDFYPRIIESEVPADLPEALILEDNLRLQELKEKYEHKKYNKTTNNSSELRRKDSKSF